MHNSDSVECLPHRSKPNNNVKPSLFASERIRNLAELEKDQYERKKDSSKQFSIPKRQESFDSDSGYGSLVDRPNSEVGLDHGTRRRAEPDHDRTAVLSGVQYLNDDGSIISNRSRLDPKFARKSTVIDSGSSYDARTESRNDPTPSVSASSFFGGQPRQGYQDRPVRDSRVKKSSKQDVSNPKVLDKLIDSDPTRFIEVEHEGEEGARVYKAEEDERSTEAVGFIPDAHRRGRSAANGEKVTSKTQTSKGKYGQDRISRHDAYDHNADQAPSVAESVRSRRGDSKSQSSGARPYRGRYDHDDNGIDAKSVAPDDSVSSVGSKPQYHLPPESFQNRLVSYRNSDKYSFKFSDRCPDGYQGPGTTANDAMGRWGSNARDANCTKSAQKNVGSSYDDSTARRSKRGYFEAH